MNFTHLTDDLSNYNKEGILFVGLGNEYRGDDGAGIEFVERLKSNKEFQKSQFIIAGRNPENHLETILIHKPQVVVFVDAAHSNNEPGGVKYFTEEEIEQTDFSTHVFSINIVKNYLLKNQKMDFIFIGIQPLSTSLNEGISQTVKSKLDEFFNVQV